MICNDATSPPALCTTKVTTLETSASTKNGTFSNNTLVHRAAGRDSCAVSVSALRTPHSAILFSGHQSSSNNTNGSVTTIGLDINPQPKNSSVSPYIFLACGLLAFLCLHISQIEQHRQQPEKSAEHVLAFGNPRDGFDVQRMPGEQRRHKRAAPERAGHFFQHRQQQQRICRVQKQVRQVKPAGPEPVELRIEHQGNPGQRMPVACVAGRKRPRDASGRQPAFDVLIVGDVIEIVVIDKPGAQQEKTYAANVPISSAAQTKRNSFFSRAISISGQFLFSHTCP